MNIDIYNKLKAELPEIKKNVLLKDFTTFKIGGFAKYFLVVKSREVLIKVIKLVKENNIPIFVLGGGSNLLISDKGFNGMIIKIQNSKFELVSRNTIKADAGVNFSRLVAFSLENSLSGFEWAGGIPGMTVGGAVYGNAQAFGIKTSELIKEVEVFDIKKNKIFYLNKEQCKFSLKTSTFKRNRNLIILSAVFVLSTEDRNLIQEKIKEFLSHRKKNHPVNFPSAGSVFVNLEKIIKNKALLKKYPELISMNNRGIIPAGFLIEKCGLKCKKIGKAQISEKHCNFIINLGGAKAQDVLKLIKLAKQKVKKVFNISLETEIQYLGF
jgi:UDP-N-acetylmuramate dehydrogenase